LVLDLSSPDFSREGQVKYDNRPWKILIKLPSRGVCFVASKAVIPVRVFHSRAVFDCPWGDFVCSAEQVIADSSVWFTSNELVSHGYTLGGVGAPEIGGVGFMDVLS